jgi:hypothetical protein
MAIRPRTRLQLRRAVITAALGALVVPACAGAAVKKPVITKVTPKNVNVGEQLTIRGKHFRVGKWKNTVLFKRAHGKALFVKASLSTRSKMRITIPKRLEKYMAVEADKPVATRFRLRVLTRKLSKRYTSRKGSPVVGPEVAKPSAGDGAGVVAPPVAPVVTAPPVVPLDPNADNDGDGVSNGLEETLLKTLPLNPDTDGDGITDGYEYASAVDLNNDSYLHPSSSLPYPDKRPYPNPLDASDRDTDFDGDSLTDIEEYDLWRYSGGKCDDSASVKDLSYSAGLKYTCTISAAGYDKQQDFEDWLVKENEGGPNDGTANVDVWTGGGSTTVNFFDLDGGGLRNDTALGTYPWAETSPYDRHGRSGGSLPDGKLSDDERDEDADGLTNWIELRGPMLPSWYKSMYKSERPYNVTYAGVDPTDPDSDGDDVRDGADDQDHDDIPNYRELSRIMVLGVEDAEDDDLADPAETLHAAAGQVNPYNPCLPYTDSDTCPISIPFDNPWAPFDSTNPDNQYYSFN